MTVPSPLDGDTSLVTFKIKVEGNELPDTFQVVSIETWLAVNKVPKAQIVVSDGDAATSDFEISNDKIFLPGNQIEIAAGYGPKQTTIFKGVILKQGIEINRTRGSKLLVEAADAALKMTLARKNDLFQKVRDGDLIGKLIANNGLAKDVATTDVELEQVVQYYATDWDLMLMRAELNGFVVTVEAGKVTVKAPDTSQPPVLGVKYGESILDFQAEMNAATQYQSSAIESSTWDLATQKIVKGAPATVTVTEPGNVSADELAKVFDVKKFPQQTGATIEQPSLPIWSSAELLKSRLAKIRGFVRFQGSALVQPGKTIQLAGVGERFNGNAFISGIHHRIAGGAWLTTVDFGLSPQWFAAETADIAAPDASGQLPPIRGLQTGIVKQVWSDPEGEFRVLINLPLLQSDDQSVWARLGTLYATQKAGAFFLPEQNDEVIVGFMNEDPRYPVVLGSVYSKTLAPKYTPAEKNYKKAIVTKGDLQINFDDENRIIEITTPGKQVITLDDKAVAISIEDSNNNKVTLTKSGITLDSGADVNITAKANITIQAGANLSLSAKADASLEGTQVTHKAKAKFSANGSGAAELTSSGMLTVQGTMVKIN